MTETKFKIYSLLVVKNEVDVIVASLKDACRWSDKIIVIDNGSTDGTWEKIQELALSIPQIIPWLRYEGAFHIGLRAKAFYAFRQEMTSNDWWNVRLDADEFYPGDVRAFLAQVPSRYRTIKKESTDYILTHEDIAQNTFSGDFEQDKSIFSHKLPVCRKERRFMRHSAALVWCNRWRYPHPWGRVYEHCIPVDHYQYRSPQQMAKRYATRQQAKSDKCGSFSHETGSSWQEYIVTNKQLEQQYLLANIVEAFNTSEQILYSGRNQLKIIGEDIVVKSFHKPRFLNSLVYGLLRASKAKRSYLNAKILEGLTPLPLVYVEQKKYGMLHDSYYACSLSTLPLTWRIIVKDSQFAHRERAARSIGRFMALMHEKGCYSLDFSGGNLLISEKGDQVQIVDLNRMRHYKHINMRRGCKQTSKLHMTTLDCRWLAEAYAEQRGWDVEKCYQLILKNHISINM